jgi:hypothetical protein
MGWLVMLSSLMIAQLRADAQLRYRYEATSGKCVAADGSEGLNPVDRSEFLKGNELKIDELECADLRGLSRINITYRRLERANLRGADLSGNGCYLTEFTNSDLTGVKFTGFRGGDCHFERSNLTKADLRGANLSQSKFEDSVLTGALFDQGTRLPFSPEEALARGMVEMR